MEAAPAMWDIGLTTPYCLPNSLASLTHSTCWPGLFAVQFLIPVTEEYWQKLTHVQDFPDSSVGKESACNVGDRGLIPGSGRSPGEGIGYPLQHSWASLVAQLVKNLPAMWETWLQSLGWEDPLKKGKASHSSILAWRIP